MLFEMLRKMRSAQGIWGGRIGMAFCLQGELIGVLFSSAGW